MSQQDTVMVYAPDTGVAHPYPSHAEQWRKYHGKVAWLFNPWTGKDRDARDIGSDTFGHLIIPTGEPYAAAACSDSERLEWLFSPRRYDEVQAKVLAIFGEWVRWGDIRKAIDATRVLGTR